MTDWLATFLSIFVDFWAIFGRFWAIFCSQRIFVTKTSGRPANVYITFSRTVDNGSGLPQNFQKTFHLFDGFNSESLIRMKPFARDWQGSHIVS
jgi:hypothetical protein